MRFDLEPVVDALVDDTVHEVGTSHAADIGWTRDAQASRVVEQSLQVTDRAAQAQALLVEMALEDAVVGAQRVARLLERDDLLDQALSRLIGRLARLGLGVDHELAGSFLRVDLEALRLLLHAVEDSAGFVLRLFDGGVGRALREYEGAADRFRVFRRVLRRRSRRGRRADGLGGALLGPRSPLFRGPYPLLNLLEGDRDTLEEVVDLVGVVAPHLLVEFDLVDDLRRDVHGGRW